MGSESSVTGDAESAYREVPNVQVAPPSILLEPVTDYLATGTRDRDTIMERVDEESQLFKARVIPPQGTDSTLATAQLAPRGPIPTSSKATLHKYDSIRSYHLSAGTNSKQQELEALNSPYHLANTPKQHDATSLNDCSQALT